MPRGRKKMEKITLEEQLALVDKEIEATESSLKNLRLNASTEQITTGQPDFLYLSPLPLSIKPLRLKLSPPKQTDTSAENL